MMAGDAVREFIDQIDAIAESSSVDVLIHSTGGDPLAAWKLMSLLRERFETVAVLVPFMAFSAATIFALGADEVVMHPHASLGPIDPQITITQADGSQRSFAFEDVGAFLRFLNNEVGLTEQATVSAVIDKLFSVVDPVHVGAAKRASELSTEVGERLLQMHMTSDEEKAQAKVIAERLNKKFFAHADAVSRSRARELQLKIADNNPQLERLIWEAFCGVESYMELRKPFIPMHHFLQNGGAPVATAAAPLVLPLNAPQDVQNNLWNHVAQQALAGMAAPGIEVAYTLVNGLIESPRAASENRTIGKMSAARVGGGEIQLSAVDSSIEWAKVDMPEEKP
ncbi:MAG: hypothetical protein H0W30_00990 [Gemmatimonadaceae bacterium]|nr:hypothetical protein [Gemmatimonadaceae bacterium]